MSSQYCFLCASDEGIFLDITTDNKQVFDEQFETCSLVKVPTTDELPTKICHKCAYELNQCTLFVEQYKSSSRQRNVRKGSCHICCQSPAKEHGFQLSKDKKLHQNVLDKLYKAFDSNVKKREYTFICLPCRYTLDLLLDLKSISEEISSKLNNVISRQVDYSNLPKIKTRVLNRKTTTTESASIAADVEQGRDGESREMTRTRSRNNKLNNDQLSKSQSKPQICNKCQSFIRSDKYTYKIPKTGHTICKNCWTELKNKANEDEKQQNVTETKSCKVFLKDVLRDSAVKEQKLHKTDENWTEESRIHRAVSDTEIDSKRQGQKRSIRNVQSEDIEITDSSNKRMRFRAKQENADSKQPASNTVANSKRQLRKYAASNASQNAGSDPVARKRPSTRRAKAKGASLSDADVDRRRYRRKLRTILAGNSALKDTGGSDETSSSEEIRSKRKKVKLTEPLNEPLITIDLTGPEKYDETDSGSKSTPTRKRRSAGRPSILKTSRKSQSSDSDNADAADAEDQSYDCKECQATYGNKVECLTHQLTHYKQPMLELERAVIESVAKETVDPQEAVDDQSEVQSETIGIRVDDDEEETVDVDKLDESGGVQVGSDKEEKALPEKTAEEDAAEDAADVELVMKESDDDQSQTGEKAAEETQKDESTEAVVPETPRKKRGRPWSKRRSRRGGRQGRSRSSGKSDESVSEPAEESNANAEEDRDASLTRAEDVEKEKPAEEEDKEERVRVEGEEDKEGERRAEGEDKEEELRVEGEDKEDEVRTEGEEKEDEVRAEGKDNEDEARAEGKGKEDEVSAEGQDNEDEARAEGKGKEDEVRAEGNDKEDEVRAEENKKDEVRAEENKEDEVRAEENKEDEVRAEENKEDEVRAEEEDKEEGVRAEVDEESEKGEVEEKSKDGEAEATSAEENNETINLKDAEDNIADEDKIDLTEADEQRETENKDTESTEDVDSKADDVVEITEIEDAENTNNGDEVIQVNGDMSAKPVVIADEVTSLKEIDITGEDDPEVIDVDATESNTVDRKESTSESVTVAAEVLQEVIDLASAEVQNRQEVVDADRDNSSAEAETLENISREIQNSVDVSPSKLDSSTSSKTNDSK